LELSDLVAEGNLGLLHSLDKYDLRRGCRLSTYASWWIRSSIERFIDMMGRNVRLPLHLADRLRRLHRAERREYLQRGLTLDLEEMAPDFGIRSEEVEALTLIEQGTTSLHSPLGESGATLETFLQDTRNLSPSDATLRHELASVVDRAMSRLSAREALVLRMRYGLKHERSHTLAEVGAALGVSRERVRQIEVKALERLRHTPAARVLSEFVDPRAPRAA
jgi:RNA polymerase primary sigma factor